MKKILLVDDDLCHQDWFIATFGSEYEVKTSTDGLEAIWRLKTFKPDIVVVDVVLPGWLDGLHLLDYVKDKPEFAHMQVVVMSGMSAKEVSQLLTKHKANAYFEKFGAKARFEKWLSLLFSGLGCPVCMQGVEGSANSVSEGLGSTLGASAGPGSIFSFGDDLTFAQG